MSQIRIVVAWLLLAGSTIGMGTNLWLWLTGLISTRSMVGVTLALSWLALIFESANALQVAYDGRHQRETA